MNEDFLVISKENAAYLLEEILRNPNLKANLTFTERIQILNIFRKELGLSYIEDIVAIID